MNNYVMNACCILNNYTMVNLHEDLEAFYNIVESIDSVSNAILSTIYEDEPIEREVINDDDIVTSVSYVFNFAEYIVRTSSILSKYINLEACISHLNALNELLCYYISKNGKYINEIVSLYNKTIISLTDSIDDHSFEGIRFTAAINIKNQLINCRDQIYIQ